MLRAIADIVFPPSCMSCGAQHTAFLCEQCAGAFPWITERCLRCGLPSPRDVDDCEDCRHLNPAFASARAPARYEAVARNMLMRFKLGGERRAARTLAEPMRAVLPASPALLTAVPSTRKSLAERGFNPAEELAKALAQATGASYRRVLRKTRETADQAGLGRVARIRNLARAFDSAPVESAPGGGSVVLVDDVLTTGATANACAEALRKAGALRVDVVTFARAGGWSKRAWPGPTAEG